jgi:hypothetical protein
MLKIGVPQDSREFILHQESSSNFRPIQTQNYVTSIKYDFWRYKPYEVQNSPKCKKFEFLLSSVL